jgi:hypothetical protein
VIDEQTTDQSSDDVNDSDEPVSDSFEELKAEKMKTMNDFEKEDSKRLLKKLLPEYTAKHNDPKLVHGMGGYYRMESMDRNSQKV